MTETIFVFICKKCNKEVFPDDGDIENGLHVDCGGEVEKVCAFCLGTGRVPKYYRGDDTGYNYVEDGSKPCVCQIKEHDGDGDND